jgi:aspartate 1-decarboxylase
MARIFITAKLHRGRVTGALLDYEGSISLPPAIMQAMGVLPFEFVHVNSLANGFHWETYALPGEAGEITLNGPPARNFRPGDLIVVNRLEHLDRIDPATLTQTVVHVNAANSIIHIETKHASVLAAPAEASQRGVFRPISGERATGEPA